MADRVGILGNCVQIVWTVVIYSCNLLFRFIKLCAMGVFFGALEMYVPEVVKLYYIVFMFINTSKIT